MTLSHLIPTNSGAAGPGGEAQLPANASAVWGGLSLVQVNADPADVLGNRVLAAGGGLEPTAAKQYRAGGGGGGGDPNSSLDKKNTHTHTIFIYIYKKINKRKRQRLPW